MNCNAIGIRAAVLLVSLSAIPAAAHAQTVDVIPFAGYGFGGSAYDYTSASTVSLDSGASYGLALDIPIDHRGESYIEIFWSHQESGAQTFAPGFVPTDLDIGIEIVQVGGMYEFTVDNPQLRPYVAATVGATSYRAKTPATGSDTVFSAGLGGGAKVMVARHFGVRFDARGIADFVSTDSAFLGCSPAGCRIGFSSSVVWHLQASVGLVIAF